jgi:hypothetical protein
VTAAPAREGYLHESAPLPFGIGKAVFSADKTYRYRLSRTWGSSGTHATWIMLNPSTADALEDDPTIRRCISFTKAWGLDGLVVVNLFALRATDPHELARHPDPVGPANDQFIRDAVSPWSVVVAAWGAHKIAAARTRAVLGILTAGAGTVGCLGVTKGGAPRHPLYVPASQALETFAGTGNPLSIEVTIP